MTGTTTIFSTIANIITLGASTVIFVAGGIGLVVGVYKFCTGGFGFMKAVKKVSRFVDRVDVLIDDFWPEILSGLESKKLISTGSTARWTSSQAKILKSHSPISITPLGDKILSDVGFSDVYKNNSQKILDYVKLKLEDRNNITDLDIEQASLEVGAELFDKDDSIIQIAKEYLFQNPTMPVSQLKVLIGIFIRDKILDDSTIKSLVTTK